MCYDNYMKTEILAMILKLSAAFNMDPAIVQSVVTVESNFNHLTIGPVGEIGLMQLRPEYFSIKKYAYNFFREPSPFDVFAHTSKDERSLFDPKENLTIGIQYLKEVQTKCSHLGEIEFVICYNRGVVGGLNVADPSRDQYVLKVSKVYYELKMSKLRAVASKDP
jgi:soluble lytic murein transglycosylase-like protein